MRTRSIVMPAALLAIALVACGGQDTPVADGLSSSQTPGASVVDADGRLTVTADSGDAPAVSIEQALGGEAEPVRITGSLIVDAAGRVLLCSALAESLPPQCGGQRLEVVGLDLDTIENMQASGGVRWADSVEVVGTVE